MGARNELHGSEAFGKPDPGSMLVPRHRSRAGAAMLRVATKHNGTVATKSRS